MIGKISSIHQGERMIDATDLNALDRCDCSCGAQAFVMAEFANGGTLLFCGHHFNKFEEKIRQQAIDIFDARNRINMNPSVSANV